MLKTIILRSIYQALFFGSGLLLANVSGPDVWSEVSIMQLHAALVVLLSGFGVEGYAMHRLAQNKWDINRAKALLFISASIQMAIFCILQLIACSYFQTSLLAQGETRLWPGETAYFFGLVLTDKLLVLYYYRKKETWFNVVLTVTTALFLLFLCFTSFQKGQSPIPLLGYLHAAQSIVLLIPFLKFSDAQVNLKSLTLIWQGSGIVMLTNIIQFLAYRVDYWILLIWQEPGELGIYAQSVRFAGLLLILPNMVAPLLFNRFSSLVKGNLQLLVQWVCFITVILTLCTALFAAICYTFVLDTAFTPGFIDFCLLLPGYSCWALITLISTFSAWQGKFNVNFRGSLLCFFTILFLDLLVIPEWGRHGAAISNSVAFLVVLIYYIIYCRLVFTWRFLGAWYPKVSDLRQLKIMIANA